MCTVVSLELRYQDNTLVTYLLWRMLLLLLFDTPPVYVLAGLHNIDSCGNDVTKLRDDDLYIVHHCLRDEFDTSTHHFRAHVR